MHIQSDKDVEKAVTDVIFISNLKVDKTIKKGIIQLYDISICSDLFRPIHSVQQYHL